MSQHTGSQHTASGALSSRGSLVRLGGALGIAAVLIGFAIFFGSCAGFDAVLKLSPLPVLMGAIGMVLGVLGAITQKNHPAVDATHALAAIMLGTMGLLGGLLEFAALMNWQIFPK